MSTFRSGLLGVLAALLLLAACAVTPPPAGNTPPDTPSGLTATALDAEVVLAWLANVENDLRRYNIYRGTTSGDLSKIAEVAAGTETFTDSTVTNGTTFFYAIDAEDTAGNLSNRTGEVEATPTDNVDVIPPTVVSTDPPDGTVDVALNASVSVTFSEPMNQAATEAAISVVPAFGCTFTWDPGGSTVTCVPGSNLTANTLYTVTVGTGAQDLAGNPLQAPFVFSFTTGIDLLATCLFDDASSLFDACVFGN